VKVSAPRMGCRFRCLRCYADNASRPSGVDFAAGYFSSLLGRVNLVLPGQLRIRLEEIHRTFVFGCWISVISLSRAALEYALHDNAKRLDVATIWPTDRDGKARSKRLTDLIDDYKNIIPTIAENLATIRDLGNKYMHPKAGKSGRLDLDDLQQDCSTIIYAIGTTIEGIYLHGREA
jgi:hypothetical protein